MKEYINENILACLVDGTLSPLEQLAYSESFSSLHDNEIIEITRDAKLMKCHIEKIKPIRFSECERYIEEIRRYELPNNLNETTKYMTKI